MKLAAFILVPIALTAFVAAWRLRRRPFRSTLLGNYLHDLNHRTPHR